jgi:hypothetical protein
LRHCKGLKSERKQWKGTTDTQLFCLSLSL